MSSASNRPVAVVTGAAAGLGRAVATVLDEAGFHLVLVDVNPLSHPEAFTESPTFLMGDVIDDDFLRRTVRNTIDRHGRIDLLVNNAGRVGYTSIDSPLDAALHTFEELWRVNTRAPYVLGRLVIPHMIEQGSGHIVNVSTDHVHTCGFPIALHHDDSPDCPWSTAPRRPLGGVAFDAYDASKWALNGITQVWSAALRRHSIRVNNLCLGATDTDMVRGAIRDLAGREPTASEIASWMPALDVARLILELHDEGPHGRTGDNVGVWVGHPMRLPDAHPVTSPRPDLR